MKKIIARITMFVTLLFDKTFAFLAKNSMVAVTVTDMLKRAVESPVADVITALIPGDVDDRIVSSLRANLPRVLFKMALIHRISTESSTNSEAIGGILAYLQEVHPDTKASFWIRFAAELNVALADGKITLAEGIYLSQMAYAGIFKKS